jgi:hypothetical protein
MFRNSVPLPLGRDAKVGGNLLAKIGCYNVHEQCSHCRLEELKRFVATFSQNLAVSVQCSGKVFTMPIGRAEKVCTCSNLLAKIGCYNV